MNLKFLSKIKLLKSKYHGQSILEYVLLCALIAVALIGIISMLKVALADKFKSISDLLGNKNIPPFTASESTSDSDSSKPQQEQSPINTSSTPAPAQAESSPLPSKSTLTKDSPLDIVLKAQVRDFNDTHPDFEKSQGAVKDLVSIDLGLDNKPVYSGLPGNNSINSKSSFDQWYNDVPGINKRIELPITLKNVNGFYTSKNYGFFPIDNKLWGNQNRSHNFHFTLEAHSKFKYRGGESLLISGDDDIWVFINKKRIIDLGGTHAELSSTVSLDQIAATVGIKKGMTYSFDLFFAERFTTISDLSIQTDMILE